MKKEKILIVGSGLVGSLLSIYLARKGFEVHVFEKRSDYRNEEAIAGRSINLALSDRGWRALKEVGIDEEIRKLAIPMRGRMVHDLKGNLSFQPYGKEGQAIYSVSRSELNIALMRAADTYPNVHYHFNQACIKADLRKNIATFQNTDTQEVTNVEATIIVGADGAYSAIRTAMLNSPRFNYSQRYINHAYKELHIPPTKDGGFALDKNSLHIWARHQFMLIALPNLDGSFTCTLFYAFEDFEKLKTKADIKAFFEENFADAIQFMPTYLEDFFDNPTSSMVVVRCSPWQYGNRSFLIGDAAHAIVPFYGQGMISGFEDCRIFNDMLEKHEGDWEKILNEYQKERIPNGNAISDLALHNFIVMRDHVTDPKFLLQKKIEAKIHTDFPDKWTPLYSMVTFSHIPYSEAQKIGKKQDAIMAKVLAIPDIENKWQEMNFSEIVAEL